MKYLLGLACTSALLLVAFADARPSANLRMPQDPSQERFQQLEAQLSGANAQIGALTKELRDTRALLEKTVTYLQAQSQAAGELQTTLDEVEAQGFAAGENWQSRKTLLDGLRKRIEAQQSGLPQLAKPDAKAEAGPKALPVAPRRRAGTPESKPAKG